jgi:hypothetical protein
MRIDWLLGLFVAWFLWHGLLAGPLDFLLGGREHTTFGDK